MSTTTETKVIPQPVPQSSPTSANGAIVDDRSKTTRNNVNEQPEYYSHWARFCQFNVMYINPWIRILVFIGVILWLYALSSSYLTWRENVFIDYLETLIPTYGITHPFRLPDVMHSSLPEMTGDAETHWQGFADATAGIWSCVFLAICLVRRDFVRLSEYVVIQIWMFAWNALAHIVTTYPDAHGYQSNCHGDPHWRILITVQYCGDMMWSGHTANTVIPVIMLRRILFDWVGWNWFDHVQTPLAVLSNGHWLGYRIGSPLTLYHYKLVTDFFRLHTITQTVITGHDHGIASYDDGHIINKVNPTEVAARERHDHPNDPRLNPNHIHHNVLPEPTVKTDEMSAIEMEQIKPSYTNATLTQGTTTIEPNTTMIATPDAPVVTDGVHTAPAVAGTPAMSLASTGPVTTAPAMAGANNNVEWRDANGNLVTSNGPSQSLPLTSEQQVALQRTTGLIVDPLDVLQHDKFFRAFRCPYVSPPIVVANPIATLIILTLIRFILFAWIVLLMFALLLIRYHYTADIVVSALISTLLCHAQMIQTSVRWFYRPNYNNYAYDKWYMPCYIERPLNEEQVNYEERMSLVGAEAWI